MRIWHDNSGKGDHASWFLKYIIIHDLQTRNKYYFLCQKWLAVEKDDGKLEREMFVACEPQKTQLRFFLQKEAKYNLADSHLWLSLFMRPIQSSFTRLDRVTCCFVFLYISSLLNMIYYDSQWQTNNQINMNLFYFKITLDQVRFLYPYCLLVKYFISPFDVYRRYKL